MFTDKFIKVPIRVFDREAAKIKEMIDEEIEDEDCIDSYVMIDKEEICWYEPSRCGDEEFGTFEHTTCKMRCGDSLFVMMHISEFENLLNGVQQSDTTSN